MHKVWLVIVVLLGGLGSFGCGNDAAFSCSDDSDCEDRDGGRCGPAGYCAFPDATCPSTLRYVEHSGSLSGKCAPLSPDSDTLADTESEGVTGDGSASTSTSGTDTSDTVGSSTAPATSAGPASTTNDPTFPPDCAQPGQTCGGDEDCCGGCLSCENALCVPRTGETEPCGECQACDATGVCAIDEGGPCDGPAIDCTEYLSGLDGQSCRAAAGEAGPTCNGLGECEPADPSECTEPGDPVVSCDVQCIDNRAACAAGALISSVSHDAMCVLDQDNGMCPGTCFLVTSVYSYYEYTERACGSSGQCDAQGEAAECGNYNCELGSGCFDTCQTNAQCFGSSTCDMVGGVMRCCGGQFDEPGCEA